MFILLYFNFWVYTIIKILFAGSDSPIPDLSALDEIPKEDWDQLLGSMDHLTQASSDTDEGIDYDPVTILITIFTIYIWV